ncbi:3' terminal RNA ribose 2'-O-methyltransferase Hen1 [Nocardia sp. 2]|uniref:Small RNA 2'-O-methyltransferase n=1 Tax=Nocardia acididurans TaxID=2802282 RepID=A0ABS1MEP4_9NOCA|nr:3' terminal RNA ribose 2'-O-methyltransferase Hen1 [Nocardia acididurans]MBL1078565.1 3' terminal RNA ribose 2'-O-methyltransferase Hen1 [Nocardia acididurans]
MLLTITCTRPDGAAWAASDLGYLLHKNPSRIQAFEQSYGVAQVLYPEASEERCTAALLLEIDPVRLVRGKAKGTPEFSLAQYVNDRPYAASSLLAVAISTVFGSALHGRCKQRPELAETALPLRIELPAVPCRGGVETVERVFAPLGWEVRATPLPLDPAFPEWGDSHYVRLELTGTLRLADALSHLYVLLPVLDGGKHYWLDSTEIDKLLRVGEGWLVGHPEREWITRRYLNRRHALVQDALARLAELDDLEPEQLGAVDDTDDETTDADASAAADEPVTGGEQEVRPPSLAVLRRATVLNALREAGANRVLDLGCGQGALLREMVADKAFTEIVGIDVSVLALRIAQRRMRRLPEWQSKRVTLRQGALTYTDASLRGYDAAVLMEVIEHVDAPRLGALEHAVFGSAAPGSVVVTTPNGEYNVRYEGMTPGAFRHSDHRFEWSRAEFAAWAHRVGETYGYTVRFEPVGPVDAELGASTQMAVFTKGIAATDSDTKGAA